MLGAAASRVTTSARSDGPAGEGAAAIVLGGAGEGLGSGADPLHPTSTSRQGVSSREFMAISWDARDDKPRIPCSMVVTFARPEGNEGPIPRGRAAGGYTASGPGRAAGSASALRSREAARSNATAV